MPAAKLYSGVIVPVAVTATSAQAGYPALNLANETIKKDWRANNAAATDIVLDYGGAYTFQAFELHDVNWQTCTIYTSPDNAVWTNQGALTTYSNRRGRRRGILAAAWAGVRYIKVSIAAGTPQGTLAFWRGCAAYAATVATTVATVVYENHVKTLVPVLTPSLANRVDAQASVGNSVDEIELNFDLQDTETIDTIVQAARDGVCILDMKESNYPAKIWPVRQHLEDADQNYYQKKFTREVLRLREAT